MRKIYFLLFVFFQVGAVFAAQKKIGCDAISGGIISPIFSLSIGVERKGRHNLDYYSICYDSELRNYFAVLDVLPADGRDFSTIANNQVLINPTNISRHEELAETWVASLDRKDAKAILKDIDVLEKKKIIDNFSQLDGVEWCFSSKKNEEICVVDPDIKTKERNLESIVGLGNVLKSIFKNIDL